jgi:pimeloyl-ACP methyl ester carboxylesterase
MLKAPVSSQPVRFSHHRVLGHSFRVCRWRSGHGGSSPPLLFFTGLGANSELLAPFLERLSGREVVTFDMPGTGGTPDFARPYRLSTMADAAGEILSQLGLSQVDVMGVSWGGMLAQEFAFRHADRVERLILAATGAGFPMIPGSPATLLKMLRSHRYSDAGTIEPYLRTLYGGVGDGFDGYASRMNAPSSTGYWHQLFAICGWTSVRKLTQISAKTLILMGKEDRLVPAANGQILKFLLRDSRLTLLEDAGHLFVLTHGEAVSQLVEQFLGARDPRPAGSSQTGDSRPLAV